MLSEDTQKIIFTKGGKINTAVIRREWFRNSEHFKNILNATLFLPHDVPLAARLYCIVNNIHEIPRCPITNQSLNWLTTKKRFALASSNAYSQKFKSIDGKKLSKSLKAAKKQYKDEFIDKYNKNDFVMQSKDCCKEFITRRLQETDCGIKHCFVDTLILKNNTDICCSILHYTQHPLLNNININWSERFYLLINDATPSTCIFDPDVKAKYINFKEGYSDSSSRKNRTLAKLKSIKLSLQQQSFDIQNNIENHQNDEYVLICNKCGATLHRRLTNARWKDVFCAQCNGVLINTSRPEAEITKFLQEECGVEVQRNKKDIISSGEIDIYIPDYQLGIEYHGLLWHSFGTTFPNNACNESRDKYKHKKKRDECFIQGIQLLQIFEHEWLHKQDIVKSIIRNKLGLTGTKVYARKCSIIYPSTKEKSAFLNENHLQGNDNSQFNIALEYEGSIVAMMTFGERQITNTVKFELIRFCCKNNISVVGGASKLLKAFIKKYKVNMITTYADLRYCFDASFYTTIGFRCIKTSLPNYWYTDCKTVLHRANFQKHKLVNSGYDKSKTERDIMLMRGWRRIWDCGHFVFEMNV